MSDCAREIVYFWFDGKARALAVGEGCTYATVDGRTFTTVDEYVREYILTAIRDMCARDTMRRYPISKKYVVLHRADWLDGKSWEDAILDGWQGCMTGIF